MTRLLFLLLILLVKFSNLQAQKIAEFSIFFETGEFKLTDKHKRTIDSVLNIHKKKTTEFDVSIVGYTDQTGSLAFNSKLAKNRAEGVKSFLKKTIKVNRAETASIAAKHVLKNKNPEKEKELNRRTQIVLSYAIPKIKNIGSVKLKQNSKSFNAEKDYSFEVESGSKISIPANVLVDENGNPVKGKVKLKYVEYRDPIDFILGGINMAYSNAQGNFIFNSSGMFYINAQQNGKNVYIKDGGKINIDFAMTQDAPGTNFFKLDTLNNTWTQQAQISQPNNTLNQLTNANDFHVAGPACAVDACEGLKFSVRFYKNIRAKNLKLYKLFLILNNIDTVQMVNLEKEIQTATKKIEALREKKDKFEQLAKNHQNCYSLKKVEGSDSKLFSVTACEKNIDSVFYYEDLLFDYSLTPNKKTPIEQQFKSFVSLRISGPDNKGLVSFQVGKTALGTKTTYGKIKLIFAKNTLSKRELKKRTEDFVFQFRKELGLYKRKYLQFMDSSYNLIAKINIAQGNLEKIKGELENLTTQFKSDTTTCFWQANKGLMLKNESKLDYRNWLKFFDKNDSLMNERFTALSDSAKLEDSCKAVAKRVNYEEEYKKETAKKMDAIMTNLSISSFGIYNCDQLARIQNPVAIAANYLNSKKDTIQIKHVYLIDKSINGVIVLNGYMNMTPYNFSYGKNSSTTLICFDKNANPWIIDAPTFSSCVKEYEGKREVMFTLKPIGKSDSKEKLLSKN